MPSDNYRPQRSWAKVIFLQASVCPQGGEGCLPQCMLGYSPWEQAPPQEQSPRDQTSPRSRHPPDQAPPRDQTPPGTRPPPGPDTTTPPGSRLQHTVNERPVRILLECILVYITVHFLLCFLLRGKLMQAVT